LPSKYIEDRIADSRLEIIPTRSKRDLAGKGNISKFFAASATLM